MAQPASLRPTVCQIPKLLRVRAPCRCKSLTAAIERGKNSWDTQPRHARRRRETAWHSPTQKRLGIGLREPLQTGGGSYQSAVDGYGPTYTENIRRGQDHAARGGETAPEEEPRQLQTESNRHESLPYTTAASEFLYGYSSVLAAVKANRRKLYKLYIHTRGANHVGISALITRAKILKIPVQEVGDEYLQALDKASSGRPHNGFVLEASPLPVPPLTSLLESSIKLGTFQVELDKQSREDMRVNGTKTKYSYRSAGWRHPLVLYVDGVLDEGNLGAIARSAYFLGVDAIVTPTRQSAPWSQIAIKASAGAAEAIPVFKVNQGTVFLGASAREGWRIYASDAVPPAQLPVLAGTSTTTSTADFTASVIYTQARSAKRLSVDHCPVENAPTILMMGAEGMGLRSSLLNLAHFKVGIRHGRDADEVGVDSLNVSAAASILCYSMLQKPRPRAPGNVLF